MLPPSTSCRHPEVEETCSPVRCVTCNPVRCSNYTFDVENCLYAECFDCINNYADPDCGLTYVLESVCLEVQKDTSKLVGYLVLYSIVISLLIFAILNVNIWRKKRSRLKIRRTIIKNLTRSMAMRQNKERLTELNMQELDIFEPTEVDNQVIELGNYVSFKDPICMIENDISNHSNKKLEVKFCDESVNRVIPDLIKPFNFVVDMGKY